MTKLEKTLPGYVISIYNTAEFFYKANNQIINHDESNKKISLSRFLEGQITQCTAVNTDNKQVQNKNTTRTITRYK